MEPEPELRRRALLPGISAAGWANGFAVSMIAGVAVLVLLGVSTQPRIPAAGLLGFVALVGGIAVVAAAVLSGTMVFVRLTAERRQGYTTIDGFRVGAGIGTDPDAPDTVDTVDAHLGVVLRDAGDADLDAALLAARQHRAQVRRRAGERPILLDRRR